MNTRNASHQYPKTYAVVIPAYNEAATIRRVAQKALQHASLVIVVDDGSSDDTAAQLEGMAVEVLRNEANMGKGGSLWRGLQHAINKGAEAVFTLDGDGQHDPGDIPDLLNEARINPHAVVIGARLLNRENAPKARLFANNFADFWISWAAGRRIRDSQSGFRLYPARALRQVQIEHDKRHGFVFESEFLIEAANQGFGFQTVAIASCYPEQARASHFRPVADISLIVRMVAGRLFRRGMYPQGLWRSLRKAA